jgi:Ca2+-binding EF-hand superfamily protein
MKQVAILAALGLAAAATLTFAAPEGASGAERFKKADVDGNGMLSRQEAAALPRIAEHFNEIDTNKDNQISAEELRAFHDKVRGQRGQKHGAMLKKLDTDGDGRISLQEAKAAPRLAEHFSAIDTNGDGFLSADELKAAREKSGRGK